MRGVQRVVVPSTNGISLATNIWKPRMPAPAAVTALPTIVIVHQWSIMGGQATLMKGIAQELSDKGFQAVTFDMRGVGRSNGRATITGNEEIEDVKAVCQWTHENLNTDLVLVGSSAGAPIAGSAVEEFDYVKGYVGIGYVFGFLASFIFSQHYDRIINSKKPKLFIMGTKDEFTSPSQLKKVLRRMQPPKEAHLIEGVSHFTLEGPDYDGMMARLTADFVRQHFSPREAGETAAT